MRQVQLAIDRMYNELPAMYGCLWLFLSSQVPAWNIVRKSFTPQSVIVPEFCLVQFMAVNLLNLLHWTEDRDLDT